MALHLARLVRSLAGLIALVIVAAIVLFLLGANPSNGIVNAIHDAGAWLVGPFKNLFSIHNAKVAMAVNWGLAALVYLLVGHLIASLLVRLPAGPDAWEARTRDSHDAGRSEAHVSPVSGMGPYKNPSFSPVDA